RISPDRNFSPRPRGPTSVPPWSDQDSGPGRPRALAAPHTGGPANTGRGDNKMNAFRMMLRRDRLIVAALLAIALMLRLPAHGASGGYNQTNVQSDIPGLAANTDPDLVNP